MERTHTEAGDIRIHRVPKHAVAAALRNPDLRSLLAKGLAAAECDDAQPFVLQLMMGTKQLWIVFEAGSATPLAAWMTSIHQESDGRHWVGVSALAGSRARQWAGLMSDRVTTFAAAEGCKRVLFFGRLGWQRLARNVKSIGQHGDIHIFERVAP